MDKQTHTPGPFSVDPTGDMGEHFFGSDEHGALGTFDEPFGKGSAAGNARRAVAAWNAVEGIPTEALEGGIVRDIIEAFREILDLVDKGDLADAQPDNPSYEVSLTLDESRRISARLRGETDA